MANERPVLVTTVHKGVFFGFVDDRYHPGDALVHLRQARNVIYWPAENRGFYGLAAWGPKAGARVGPAVPESELRDITGVHQCTPEAVQAFEAHKWNR